MFSKKGSLKLFQGGQPLGELIEELEIIYDKYHETKELGKGKPFLNHLLEAAVHDAVFVNDTADALVYALQPGVPTEKPYGYLWEYAEDNGVKVEHTDGLTVCSKNGYLVAVGDSYVTVRNNTNPHDTMYMGVKSEDSIKTALDYVLCKE